MTQTRQKHAFSDHSDLVARRMGFIPFPLGVVLIKALYSAISIENFAAVLLLVMAFVTLLSCRILNTICALGKACDLMQTHQKEKSAEKNAGTTGGTAATPATGATANVNIAGIHPLPVTPRHNEKSTHIQLIETATSPSPFSPLQRSVTVDTVPDLKAHQEKPSSPNTNLLTDPNLGATALFSNSDVDLDDVCLNDNVLNGNHDEIPEEQVLTRSVPDLQQETENEIEIRTQTVQKRTHKRSESEPFIHAENGGNH